MSSEEEIKEYRDREALEKSDCGTMRRQRRVLENGGNRTKSWQKW